MGEIIGYARTSTVEQSAGLADQEAELRAAGVTKLFSEQVSGADARRPKLREALQYAREGDVFVCTKADRLARSTLDLLTIVQDLIERKVTVRILSMLPGEHGKPGAGVDTSTATGKLLLTMLAGVAEFERALMLERQRAGIAAAKAAGRYKGRAPTAQRKAGDVLALKRDGMPIPQIVKATGISRASVYRILGDVAA